MTPLMLALLFAAASRNFGLPPNLLDSLCFVESSHRITAIHEDDGNSDSLGVCQIKFETAQWLGFEGTADDLMDPSVNIYYAAKFLSYQLKRYRGQTEKAVIAYNRGNAAGVTRTSYSVKVLKQWGKL